MTDTLPSWNELEALGRETRVPGLVLERLQTTVEHVRADARLSRITIALARALSAGGSVQPDWGALGPDEGSRDGGYPFHLLIALLQVPRTRSRHAELGVDPLVTQHTLADVGLWCRDFERFNAFGLTREGLEWLQHHLRSSLYRVGNHEFEAMPFVTTVAVFRERATGEVRSLATEGLAWDGDGGARGRPLDDRAGSFLDAPVSLPGGAWQCVVQPGAPMLELHTPADARIGERYALDSIQQGFEFFARLAPEQRPLGIWGKGWFLDPQVRELLPRNRGIHWFHRTCHLFPYEIPERNTIRRFFGPDVTRADLPTLDPTKLDTLQTRIVQLLADPARTLVGRGAFITIEELERLWAARAARSSSADAEE